MLKDKKSIIFRNIRSQIRLIKRYYYLGKNNLVVNSAIAMIDGRYYHGGLTDRLKGIISIYAYAKSVNIPFRINFTYPFMLNDFLCPNRYNWMLEMNGIIYNIRYANPIVLFSELSGKRLSRLKKTRQHHFYLNRDLIPAINNIYHHNYIFSELFNELFKPAPILDQAIKNQLNIINGQYIAIVFRFQQLLNDFNEGNFEILSPDDRERLIQKCLIAIDDIAQLNKGKKCLVTSDSKTFLKLANEKPNVEILPGELSHMEFPTGNENQLVHMKSFLDLFMISKSDKVYSVLIKGFNMYPSEFPKYAALIGNIPFERIYL